jgi:hypothetical protein
LREHCTVPHSALAANVGGVARHFRIIDSTASGEKMANRYPLVDQVVVAAGCPPTPGCGSTWGVWRSSRSTGGHRRRPTPVLRSEEETGTSDHLPLMAKLIY